MKIVILGWGSLLWDKTHREFDRHHSKWKLDGPTLKLEFSRESASRLNALTLVIDPIHDSGLSAEAKAELWRLNMCGAHRVSS